MQEHSFQRAKLTSVVRDRAIAVESADVPLPNQLAGVLMATWEQRRSTVSITINAAAANGCALDQGASPRASK